MIMTMKYNKYVHMHHMILYVHMITRVCVCVSSIVYVLVCALHTDHEWLQPAQPVYIWAQLRMIPRLGPDSNPQMGPT